LRIVIASKQPVHSLLHFIGVEIRWGITDNNSFLGDVKRDQIYKMKAMCGCWKCHLKKAECTDLPYQKHFQYPFHLQK